MANRGNTCTVVEDTSGISEISDQCAITVIVVSADNEILTNSEPVSFLTTDRHEENCKPTTTETECTQLPIVTKIEQAEMEPECNLCHAPEPLPHNDKAEVETQNLGLTWN